MVKIFKNKRFVILLVSLFFFILGGLTYNLFLKGGGDENPKADSQEEELVNGYTKEGSYYHTFNDFIISAGQGSYIIKMTVTVQFNSPEAYSIFKGLAEDIRVTEKEINDEELTLMEIAINDRIGTLMFEIDEETLLNKRELSKYLKEALNEEFQLHEEGIVEELYIENLVIQ